MRSGWHATQLRCCGSRPTKLVHTGQPWLGQANHKATAVGLHSPNPTLNPHAFWMASTCLRRMRLCYFQENYHSRRKSARRWLEDTSSRSGSSRQLETTQKCNIPEALVESAQATHQDWVQLKAYSRRGAVPTTLLRRADVSGATRYGESSVPKVLDASH